MNLQEFKESLGNEEPPSRLGRALEALWFARKGDWNGAHERAQAQEDKAGAWVHAHLHRQEGDAGNAGYWYRHAGRPAATSALQDEWDEIAAALLKGSVE